jgi:hypothetical protein
MSDLLQGAWFAGHRGRLLLYRVNRRPKYAETMFPADMPADVFDHFLRMLAPGTEVVSGHQNQRIWRVGGIQYDSAESILTGRLGWQPREGEVVSQWSDEAMDWQTTTVEPKEHKLMPFGFDGESRLLTVLTDGKSSLTTIPSMFEQILRKNEAESHEPTTEWSVEPVLDRNDFLTWLDGLDVVSSVSFTAKLPNPEPIDEFRELFDRLTKVHATQHKETMSSTRDEGLIEVNHDKVIKQAIAMAQHGFATLLGKGKRNGSLTSYNQQQKVATESVDELPDSWEGMRALLKDLLQGSLRRFKDEREP